MHHPEWALNGYQKGKVFYLTYQLTYLCTYLALSIGGGLVAAVFAVFVLCIKQGRHLYLSIGAHPQQHYSSLLSLSTIAIQTLKNKRKKVAQ